MRKNVKDGKRFKRLNITLPQGLFDEAEKLRDTFHFGGISDLLQHLIRKAAFWPEDQNLKLPNQASKAAKVNTEEEIPSTLSFSFPSPIPESSGQKTKFKSK